MRRTGTLLMAAVGSVAISSVVIDADRPQSPPAAIDFNRDIRPIFVTNCYDCHGPNERYRETNFHLDTEDGSYLDDGVIVPGKSADSRLIQRITHPDPRDRMPPAESGYDPLTPQQIQLLRRWIDEGAKWPSTKTP